MVDLLRRNSRGSNLNKSILHNYIPRWMDGGGGFIFILIPTYDADLQEPIDGAVEERVAHIND